MQILRKTIIFFLMLFAADSNVCPAALINLPNASFESPATSSVDSRIDSWQKSPRPSWWDEGLFGPWDQETGAISTNALAIDRVDASQTLYFYAMPDLSIFQDYDSIGGTNTLPSHDFNAFYEPGKSYVLTAGIAGGGAGGMYPGASMKLSLYYRLGSSNRVVVATTNIVYGQTPSLTNNSLMDFSVTTSPVKDTDLWAGQHIGVEVGSSLTNFNLAGGAWIVDHLRLTSTSRPIIQSGSWADGHFSFTLQSEPALRFEILTSTNLLQPLSNWNRLVILTNLIGSISFVDSNNISNQRFYSAHQMP